MEAPNRSQRKPGRRAQGHRVEEQITGIDLDTASNRMDSWIRQNAGLIRRMRTEAEVDNSNMVSLDEHCSSVATEWSSADGVEEV